MKTFSRYEIYLQPVFLHNQLIEAAKVSEKRTSNNGRKKRVRKCFSTERIPKKKKTGEKKCWAVEQIERINEQRNKGIASTWKMKRWGEPTVVATEQLTNTCDSFQTLKLIIKLF